ncbi:hypothetical protein COB55_03575 [Candidatus Wolfebacteria bacterium]|nr:MAG: hypothetical protein COB55_03575 [Candidatus Wolfebacteria bacterium]
MRNRKIEITDDELNFKIDIIGETRQLEIYFNEKNIELRSHIKSLSEERLNIIIDYYIPIDSNVELSYGDFKDKWIEV